jgi:LCP family protein required for cell wall assembly
MKRKTAREKILLISDFAIIFAIVTLVVFVTFRVTRKNIAQAESYGGANDNIVSFEGKKYAYNSDLYTVLFMGLDSRGMVWNSQYENVKSCGVQSDTMVLFILNLKNRSFKVLPINRDTITTLDIFDYSGKPSGTGRGQITLQYAYASGGQQSCEYASKAVSNLLYGVKVDRYVALSLDSISKLNDQIGGISLECIEDVHETDFKKGDKLNLHGEDAEKYVRNRIHDSSGGNNLRMERQKQYFRAYVAKYLKCMKKDISLPLQTYDLLKDDMNTNIKPTELVKLIGTFKHADFGGDIYLTEPGELKFNEATSHDEFYVDDKALYKLVLDEFYTEVQ